MKKPVEKFYRESDIIKIIDEHTNESGRLDDDISCILEEIPNYDVQNCNITSKEEKRYIDSTEFQTKVLNYIGSEDFNKMVNSTMFKDDQDCKNAMIHGMYIASMLTCKCEALYLKKMKLRFRDE